MLTPEGIRQRTEEVLAAYAAVHPLTDGNRPAVTSWARAEALAEAAWDYMEDLSPNDRLMPSSPGQSSPAQVWVKQSGLASRLWVALGHAAS